MSGPGRWGRCAAGICARGHGHTVAIALALSIGAAGCALRGAYVDGRLTPAPTADGVLHRLVLIGDAGAPKAPEPVLTVARVWAERQRGRTTVVFLGDNAYPRGLVERRRVEAERRLTRQVEAFAGSGARVLFVPGNHDWDKSGDEGLRAIEAQSAFVRARGAGFIPSAGCPGPEHVDLSSAGGPVLRVVAVDTQWWLHGHERGPSCTSSTSEAVATALSGALDTTLPVVVVAHHPLATHGPHGGFLDWKAHLFPLGEIWSWGRAIPLPLVGSIYPALRRLAPSRQDIASTVNREMREALERPLTAATKPALKIFAAGHEHSLQVLERPSVDLALVSGSGSSAHQTPVTRGRDTLFAASKAGFMVIDVTDAGLRLAIVDPSAPPDATVPAFAVAKRH